MSEVIPAVKGESDDAEVEEQATQAEEEEEMVCPLEKLRDECRANNHHDLV